MPRFLFSSSRNFGSLSVGAYDSLRLKSTPTLLISAIRLVFVPESICEKLWGPPLSLFPIAASAAMNPLSVVRTPAGSELLEVILLCLWSPACWYF